MRNFIFIVAILFIQIATVGSVQSQKIVDFGVIIQEEIDMIEYDQDKSAEAVVLLDIGGSRFLETEYSFNVLFEKRTRIKIFNKAGYKHAEISIPYYQEGNIYEKVDELEGYTYNFENGILHKTPLDIKKTYDEKLNEFWNLKKFAMPNVKEGSIIEFRYKITSPYKFQLRDWNFQSDIPVIYSSYETRMVPFYTYTYILQGASKFDHFESYKDTGLGRQYRGAGAYLNTTYNDMVYKFTMKNVPAFRDERFITSKNDYIIKLDFQLSAHYNYRGVKTDIITTWPKLSNDLLKGDYGRYLSASEKAAKKMIDFNGLNGKNEMEKIEYIVNLVKSNFSWNDRYSKYPYKTVNDFVKAKRGYSSNINLFLTGALRAAGIKANPVLISTRSHGKIPLDYPFANFFNSTIALAKLENGMILLDATEPACPFNLIPSECLNERGLIIEKDSEQWVELSLPIPSSIQKSFLLTLSPENDSIYCKMNIRSIGYDAVNQRKMFIDKPEVVSDYFYKKGLHINNDSITFTNLSNNQLPYIFQFKATTKSETFGNKIYISPFLKVPMAENVLTQERRTFPIDMVYSYNRMFNSTIEIPQGYKVESLPSNYKYSNDQVDIEYKVIQGDGVVQVIGNYLFKKAVYPTSDYSRIKYFFNEIIRVFNEKVVLVKEDIN